MWSHLVLLVFVGFACASPGPAWKENTEYVYLVQGRTFTSLHELSNQYSGIFLKAKLYITPYTENKLYAKISEAQYAQVHSQLPGGWNTYIPESQLSFKPLEISDKPFHILLRDGVIEGLIVEKDMSNWEANIVKSIVSQFQLDVKGKKIIPSPINNVPTEDRFDGVFKTMEETVTGETETTYDIHRLPEYLIQSKPWLVPQLQLRGDGQVVEIIKNKNYTHSKERPAYHYGFGEVTQGHPTYNTMGRFYSRQSNSRVIVTGKPSRYLIQNSQTVNKIIMNPTLNAKEQGLVVSAVNVTLYKVKSQSQQPQELVNPIEIGDLVYTYEQPFDKTKNVYQKLQSHYNPDFPSEEEVEHSWPRSRRSVESPVIEKRYEDSSSSEEVDQYQPRSSMSDPPQSPFLPYYVGYYGKSIKANNDFDIKQNVKRIAKEISEDVQSPEKILTHSTLNKYVMLCSLIRVMNQEEIKSVAEELYPQSKRGPERLTWVAYRDAVADAGTGPAFLIIQEWIESKKIEKQESCDVISSMTHAVRVPTEEYMRSFFELVKKVYQQEYLNETSVLAFSSLVNKVYVNRNHSYNEYPVHSFKNFYTKEGKEFVKSTVIPYLTQQLHNAVSHADPRKIHIYIRALGNVGHRYILRAFEPYLEGEKQASQFQRMLMVLSMDKLVENDPRVARSVLYKIYQNVGEIPEVRMVAVYQLMKTNPPVEILLRMAENTNSDPQEQVNAVVKSVIESGAKFTSPEYQEQRRAAELAKPYLTKKQYGKHQSLALIQHFIVNNMNLELQHSLVQIGSTDYSLPKGVKYAIRGNMNGMKSYFFNVQSMVSSLKELTNVFYKQTKNYQQAYQRSQQYSDTTQWSSPKIAESLNLQTNEREQLEGFIHAQIQHIYRFWSFNNDTIERLPQMIREKEEMMKNGYEFSYAKLGQIRELVLSLPTEMGLPFVYTYDQPMFVHFEGSAKALATPEISDSNKLQIPDKVSAQIDGFFTISKKEQCHLKIVAPFEHQMYIAGYDKNVQAHVPLRFKAEFDFENHEAEIEYEVKEAHKDARLLHYSSWPYTSRVDIMSLTPVALNPNTHLIKPEGNTHRSFDFVFGQKSTGLGFRVWGHHPQQSKNLLEFVKMLQTSDISTIWELIWDEASMHQTEATIALIPEKTTTHKIKFTLRHKEKYQREPENQNDKDFASIEELSSKVQPESEQSQEEMLKYVGAGIQNARMHSLQGVFEFQGDQQYQHVYTIALAKSHVSPKSRFVAFYKKMDETPYEAVIQVKSYEPNPSVLDLTYSLKTDPKAQYEILMQHRDHEEECSEVRTTVDLRRSAERKHYIERQPLYEVCKRQMQKGNRHLPACQNLTIESNYYDDIKVKIQYQNIKPEVSSSVDNVFKGIRFFYYPMSYTKNIQPEGKNQVTMRVKFQPETLRQVNISVRAQDEETKIYNISMSELVRSVFVPHPVYHLQARVMGKIMEQDNMNPTCVIDKQAAQTFSNMTYRISLGTDWSLMMQYIPQEARRGENRQEPAEQLRYLAENFAVLVRQLTSGQKEVKVTFNNPETEGKTIELTMKPKQQGSLPLVSVEVDGKKVNFDDKKAADLFDGYVEIYALPNGEVTIEIKDWFNIVFDGERIKLTPTSDKLRDSVVGLCGRFSEDQYEDFWTPNNCIVRSPEKFAQSFVISGDRTSRSNQQYQECIPKVLPLYADVISDSDIERTRSYREGKSSRGVILRNRYVEENGDICFTIHPVPTCERGVGASVSKSVPVHCVTKTKTAYYLKNQLDQGGNPDFSKKAQTKYVQMEIPKYCY